MPKRRQSHGFLLWVLGELTAVVLLVVFVILLASMPPVRLIPNQSGLAGYSIRVDTKVWRANASQYWATIKSGSLGVDAKQKPVAPLIAERFQGSIKLLGLSALLAIVLGVLKGLWDFRSMRRRRGGGIGPALTSAVQGLPDFWLILMLQLGAIWLYNHYGWRPFRIAYNAEDQLGSLFLPVFCLALIPASYVARITSSALVGIWEREYIRTARAKGLHELKVVFKHALRNASVQILDGLPNVAAIMVANLLIVEYMFRYPGLTTQLLQAIPAFSRTGPFGMPADANVPILAGTGIALGLTFSILHLAINFARRLADPRLKERETA